MSVGELSWGLRGRAREAWELTCGGLGVELEELGTELGGESVELEWAGGWIT